MGKLKNIIIVMALIFCYYLAGCSGKGLSLEQEVMDVVDNHLKYASQLKWEEAEKYLTGEALLETRANKEKVKDKENVVSRKSEVRILTENLATATVDITTNKDRAAYKFRLIRNNGQWYIYKTEPGEYLHDKLKHGEGTNTAKQHIKTYIELPRTERDKRSMEFLAGRLLLANMRQNVASEFDTDIRQLVEKVKEINCFGQSKDYALYEVVSVVTDVETDQSFDIKAIYDLVEVNGNWKICRMDILEMR